MDITQVFKDFYGAENVDASEQTIFVRLPDFVLQHEDREHTIRGMYLQFRFYQEKTRLYSLSAFRSVQTVQEYGVSFLHPHLRTGRVGFNPKEFCTGGGAFDNHLRYFCINEYDKEQIQFFLTHLNYFITQEDRRNPYITMERVLPLFEPIKEEYNYLSLVEGVVKDLHFDNNLKVLDNEHNNQVLLDKFPVNVIVIEGKEWMLRNYDNSLLDTYEPEYMFDFNGEPVFTSLVADEDLEIDISSYQRKLPNYTFDNFTRVIRPRLKNRILYANCRNSEAQDGFDYISRMLESDKISMLSHL